MYVIKQAYAVVRNFSTMSDAEQAQFPHIVNEIVLDLDVELENYVGRQASAAQSRETIAAYLQDNYYFAGKCSAYMTVLERLIGKHPLFDEIFHCISDQSEE